MHFKELQRKSFARMTQQTEHVCQRFQMLLLVSLKAFTDFLKFYVQFCLRLPRRHKIPRHICVKTFT